MLHSISSAFGESTVPQNSDSDWTPSLKELMLPFKRLPSLKSPSDTAGEGLFLKLRKYR